MKRFACWDPEAVHQTIVDDAPRDAPAVFAAVHRPMRILRKTIRTRHGEQGALVTEGDVLDDLLRHDGQDRFIPITGDSGTGKSHLIRWLADHIPDDPTRHVVYIEKRGTSLRKVIDRILHGMDAPGVPNADRFAELQRQVAEAAGGIDRETAPLRLLQEVAMAIREHGLEAAVDADEGELEDREDLAERLPDLITDPEFRIPLMESDGVIATSIRQALDGSRSAIEDGQAPEFSMADLSFTAVDATAAARRAQSLRADLYGDDSLKALGIRMMNEALPTAVKSMLGLKGEDLLEVLLQVREALHEADKSLVLLVEDLALLRGVEGELIEAMIATPDPGGTRTLCVMRSAVAVTPGYFDSLRTALTRMDARGPLYNLDAAIGADGVTDEDIQAFVATYLNAARWGREQLEQQFRSADPAARAEGSWRRSFCKDCRFSDGCHVAFGAQEGFGLYPFNAPALRRVIESQMKAFDPRHILTILSRTLRDEAATIEAGAFPTREWAELYDAQRVVGQPELSYMPPEVEADLQGTDLHAERRVTLLTFWGGAPRHVVNLPDTIHTAFDLAPLLGVETLVPELAESPSQVRPISPRPRSTTRPGPAPASEDPLTLWANGRRLDQRVATELRKQLRDLVRGAVDWAALGLDVVYVDQVLVPEAFFIKEAGGGGTPRDPIAVLEPTAANAVLFGSLRGANDHRDWSFDRGTERWVELSEHIETWAAEALTRIRREKRGGDIDVLPALSQALLLSSALIGEADPGASDVALVVRALTQPPVPAGTTGWEGARRKAASAPGSSAAPRETLLNRLLTSVGLHRALDRAPAVIAVDPVPVLVAIDALRDKRWGPVEPEPLRSLHRSFGAYAQGLNTILEKDLAAHIAALAQQRGRAAAVFGKRDTATKVAKTFEELDQAARDAQVGARSAAVRRQQILSSFRKIDLKSLARLAALDRPEALDSLARLSYINTEDAEALPAIGDFLDWSEGMMQEVTTSLERRIGDGAKEDGGVDGATADLTQVLRSLLDSFEWTG